MWRATPATNDAAMRVKAAAVLVHQYAIPLGYGQAEDRAHAPEASYGEYLIKPIQSEALLRLIGWHATVLKGGAGCAP